jgi:hypothetical protein
VLAGYQYDIAATPSVAAARPASRNILLAAERKATVAPVPGFHGNDDFVDEHWEIRRNCPWAATLPD